MAKRVVAIRARFKDDDARLTEKVLVPVHYLDKNGKIRYKEVRLTGAEKRVIESLAMLLFIEHKKVVKISHLEDGMTELSAALHIGEIEG